MPLKDPKLAIPLHCLNFLSTPLASAIILRTFISSCVMANLRGAFSMRQVEWLKKSGSFQGLPSLPERSQPLCLEPSEWRCPQTRARVTGTCHVVLLTTRIDEPGKTTLKMAKRPRLALHAALCPPLFPANVNSDDSSGSSSSEDDQIYVGKLAELFGVPQHISKIENYAEKVVETPTRITR